MGQVAMADFANVQGLNAVGGTAWQETIESGPVITGAAGTGRFGLIQSGALETSNVDLTQQLVSLITAQRNFQANARSIETANSILRSKAMPIILPMSVRLVSSPRWTFSNQTRYPVQVTLIVCTSVMKAVVLI
jgi:hypothetical protein